ncbi:hypothetical protein E5335_08120 [Coriobacteriaceae bacterium]|nr:hypothetical protein E5335_08120 [Coriobacteriaceae bacterium]
MGNKVRGAQERHPRYVAVLWSNDGGIVEPSRPCLIGTGDATPWGKAETGGGTMGKGRRALAVVGTVAVAGALCGLAVFSKSSYPTITVQLPANRAAGYTWVCSVKPEGSFVTVDTRYAPENVDDPDGGGVETFVLQSRSQGTSQVSFACVDGDDGTIDSTATYEFTTDGSTIQSSGTTADISDALMAPFTAGGASESAA